jgi:tetratricopeptide (TPR) repeat protein/O-antigen ligase
LRENHKTGQGSLSVFCDKVIEAGWMAIVVVVPLFFHVYSYRSFEPDKIALMRSVALVMGLAWVIKGLEVGSWRLEVGSWKLVLRLPLVLPTLFLAIVYIITTITSIAPQLSLWGSYHRMQGTYTTLSYIAIFFLVLHALRNRKQLHRLITAMLFTSLPISLYGIMQHYGLDPIAWTNIGYEITARAISTMGNPIFVAAYLIMIVPLTAGRLMQLYSSIRRGKRTASLYVLSGCYAFLLVVQLLCILFTQSRGPLLGLMGSAFFFFLLLATSRGKKGIALAVFGVAIILGLLLLALNLSDTTFESIQEMPYLGPLSSVLDFESPTSWQRILAWEGATNLVTADPRRATIGYGPETMIMALNPYLPPDLAILKPDETFDRSHNETLDILATTGFMGFATYLLLFGSLFYYGLNYLGLVESSKHRSLFILLCLVGGSAGGLLPWLWEGKWRFAGVGIPAGMLLALAIYLMTTFKVQLPTPRLGSGKASNFQLPTPVLSPVEVSNLQLLLIALLSAIIAHFIEIQFGIAIVATRTYFWVYAALMIIVGFYLQGEPALEHPEGDLSLPQALDKRPNKQRRGATRQKPVHTGEVSTVPSTQGASLVSYSLLVGLILATMGFALIGRQVNSQGQRFALWGFFVAVWFICGTMASAEAGVGITPFTDSIKRAPLLISLGWFVVFIIVHVFAMQGDTAHLFMLYYVYLFSTIIVVAVVLLKTLPIIIRFQARIHWWPYPLLTIGIAILIIIANLNPIKADVHYRRGLDYANGGQWNESIALFQRALELAPDQDFYYLFLAGAYVEKARAVSDTTQRSAWLEEARRLLEQGHEIAPLNPDHVSKLGLLYRTWGEMLTDEQEKTEKFDKALDYYRQAEALSPHDPKIFNEWGLVHFAKGEYEQAIDKYQRSLSLNNRSIQTYLLLGDAYRASEDFARAMEACERIVEIAPDDFMAHGRLALLYEQMGRIEEALAEAEIARSLAPGNEAAALEEFIIYLRAQRQ